MQILVLAPHPPASSGMPGSPRLFNLCRQLATRHDLHLACFPGSEERAAAFRDHPEVPEVFRQITILPTAGRADWLGRQRHRLHLAAHFVTRFRHPDHHLRISRMVQELCGGPDGAELILADTLAMSQYVARTFATPAVIDLHDSLTMLYRRTARQEPSLRRRLSWTVEAMGAASLERGLHRRFRAVITNSEVDSGVLRAMAPTTRVETITNGVDTDYFAEAPLPEGGQRLVFTGVMGYAPNEDAVLHFCSDIHPLIRERVPGADFWGVGHGPSQALQALTARPGIHITGTVPDVRPYLASAAVFVCPLRFGSGMKNKILAAMATGRAVVATPLSLEGIDAEPDRHVLVAEDAEAFASRVVRLLDDPREASALGANARQLVVERYSWASRGTALDALLREVAAEASRSAG
jgi:sugar transferase (PEP-CTERM/EpsH1 system associated)